ncbi:MAG TPA: hypothetical protein VJZ51_06840 [Bacilli bacterium]|nr:hypothetical protein [Bacilli bacterium]
MNDNFEKKLTKIMMILGAVAIVAVILIFFPWGGEKGKIRGEYDFLENNDHVFTYITMDEIKTNIDNGKSFQLYLGNETLNNVNYFVYYVNQLAKNNNEEVVYYLDFFDMSIDDLTYIRSKSSVEVETSVPTMIYFKQDIVENISKAFDISCIRNLKDYESNYWLLLEDYFRNCYSN